MEPALPKGNKIYSLLPPTLDCITFIGSGILASASTIWINDPTTKTGIVIAGFLNAAALGIANHFTTTDENTSLLYKIVLTIGVLAITTMATPYLIIVLKNRFAIILTSNIAVQIGGLNLVAKALTYLLFLRSHQTPLEMPTIPEEIKSHPDTNQKSKPNWRIFLEEQLEKQLSSMIPPKTFGIAEENGDCFFNAVAQLLARQGNKSFTTRKIRADMKKHVANANDALNNYYKKLLQNNIDGYTFEYFCENIDKCHDTMGGGVIWGNHATLQMIANMYSLEVTVHSCDLINCDEEDIHSVYQDFERVEYIVEGSKSYEICTLLDTSTCKPTTGNLIQGKIELACISRDPWGHYVPVFDKMPT